MECSLLVFRFKAYVAQICALVFVMKKGAIMEKDNEGLIEAKKLAKYIINTSPRRMSNLELQKTMYFAELDYRKRTGQQLIKEDFEAWQYGPVVRDVYNDYCDYGPDLIERTGKNIDLNNVNTDIIDMTVDRCSDKRSWELVEESHRSDGAWQKSIDRGVPLKDPIAQDLITEEAKKYGR